MGERFLNEGCVFSCSKCPSVVIKAIETLNHNVKMEKRKLLTTQAQLCIITPGFCEDSPIPPEAGVNCLCDVLVVGNWNGHSKHMAGGKNLLLESSKFHCTIGGGDISVLNNVIKKEQQEIYGIFTLKDAGIKNRQETGSAKGEQKGENVVEKESDHENEAEKRDNKTEKNSDFRDEKEEILCEDLYCPYDSEKEKCNNCRYALCEDTYMKSAKIPSVKKEPCAILRKNYEEQFNTLGKTRISYKHPCETIQQEYEKFERIQCGNAAHHILSTKDVFEKNKLRFVLKMANFYEYDVNEAYNCLILPGLNISEERNKTEFQMKFGKYIDYEKRKKKYDAMGNTGRQWHGGGHGKDFENEHNISCYATEVSDLLYAYMKKEPKQHCRIDEAYYEKDKERFIKIIHRVTDIVREKMILYEDDRQKSKPYYVSEASYEYAFNVFNISFLVFRREKDGIQAYKYKISNKNGVSSIKNLGIKKFDLNKKWEVKLLVMFCEQIDIAYFDMAGGEILLPFSVSNVIQINLQEISSKEYFEKNISSVEAEIADLKKSYDNVRMRRLKEIGG